MWGGGEAASGRSRAMALAAQRGIDGFAVVISSLGVAAFSVIIVYVVFARYVIGATPFWAEELPRLLLVWVTFTGAVSAFVRGSHFEAGLLPLLLGEGRARSGLTLFAGLCTIAFLLVLAWTGGDLSMRTWENRTTALQWPVGLTYLALPVCCSLSAIAVALRLAAGAPHERRELSE
jgi:TRAP-type transport system small permease protein